MGEFQTLADMVSRFGEYADSDALIAFTDEGRNVWSYDQLHEDIVRLANGLAQAGLNKGEAVLLVGPNIPEWIVAYFAIICVGGVAVPIDEALGADEIAAIAKNCACRFAFAGTKHVTTIKRLEHPPEIFLLDGEETGTSGWRTLLGPDTALPPPAPDDTASMLYTSGTTGTPKAVPLTHANFMANLNALLAEQLVDQTDVVLCPLPFHHAYPFTVGLLGALGSGATLVNPAGVSGPQLVRALQNTRATIMIGVPRLYTALLAGIERRIEGQGKMAFAALHLFLPLSRIVYRMCGVRIGRRVFRVLHAEFGGRLRYLVSGGAHLEAETERKLTGFGWEVLSGYGLTETAPILTFNIPGRMRAGTAGRALPGVELRIADPSAKGIGEVQARGPNIFSGYHDNPEANRHAFTADSWFRTGDLGFLDTDGYLHIVGRTKEVIVLPDGKNIFPEEVEAHYVASPFIREAAVFEREGRLAALFVPDEEELREQGAIQAQTLIQQAVEDVGLALPAYRRIGEFRLVREPLPRTRLGKLRRHLIPPLYDHGEARTPKPADTVLSEADRQILAGEPARSVWPWLKQRFPDTPLHPETSPQLDLGIDSLDWTALTLELQEQFSVALTEDETARILTLRDLLTSINAAADRSETVPSLPVDDVEEQRSGRLPRALGFLLFILNYIVFKFFFRLRVRGIDSVPKTGPLVLAPNHTSYLDPLAVGSALGFRRLLSTYWIGWTGIMFTGPFTRFISRISGVVPVDPDKYTARVLAAAATLLERGETVVWFPEGRRSLTGELGRFHPGIGQLLSNTGTHAVPVLIEGSFEALPRGSRLPRRIPITVTFGPPVSPDELAVLGAGRNRWEQIADGLRQKIAEMGATPP